MTVFFVFLSNSDNSNIFKRVSLLMATQQVCVVYVSMCCVCKYVCIVCIYVCVVCIYVVCMCVV